MKLKSSQFSEKSVKDFFQNNKSDSNKQTINDNNNTRKTTSIIQNTKSPSIQSAFKIDDLPNNQNQNNTEIISFHKKSLHQKLQRYQSGLLQQLKLKDIPFEERSQNIFKFSEEKFQDQIIKRELIKIKGDLIQNIKQHEMATQFVGNIYQQNLQNQQKLLLEFTNLEVKIENYHKSITIKEFIEKCEYWQTLNLEGEQLLNDLNHFLKEIIKTIIYITPNQIVIDMKNRIKVPIEEQVQKLLKAFQIDQDELIHFDFETMELNEQFAKQMYELAGCFFVKTENQYAINKKLENLEEKSKKQFQNFEEEIDDLINFFEVCRNQSYFLRDLQILIEYFKEESTDLNTTIEIKLKKFVLYLSNFKYDCEKLYRLYNLGYTNYHEIEVQANYIIQDAINIQFPFSNNKENNYKLLQNQKSAVEKEMQKLIALKIDLENYQEQKQFFKFQQKQEIQFQIKKIVLLFDQIKTDDLKILENLQSLEGFEQDLFTIQKKVQQIKMIIPREGFLDNLNENIFTIHKMIFQLVQIRNQIGCQHLNYGLILFPNQFQKLDNDIENEIIVLENLKNIIEVKVQGFDDTQFVTAFKIIDEANKYQKQMKEIIQQNQPKIEDEEFEMFDKKFSSILDQISENLLNLHIPDKVKVELQKAYQNLIQEQNCYLMFFAFKKVVALIDTDKVFTVLNNSKIKDKHFPQESIMGLVEEFKRIETLIGLNLNKNEQCPSYHEKLGVFIQFLLKIQNCYLKCNYFIKYRDKKDKSKLKNFETVNIVAEIEDLTKEILTILKEKQKIIKPYDKKLLVAYENFKNQNMQWYNTEECLKENNERMRFLDSQVKVNYKGIEKAAKKILEIQKNYFREIQKNSVLDLPELDFQNLKTNIDNGVHEIEFRQKQFESQEQEWEKLKLEYLELQLESNFLIDITIQTFIYMNTAKQLLSQKFEFTPQIVDIIKNLNDQLQEKINFSRQKFVSYSMNELYVNTCNVLKVLLKNLRFVRSSMKAYFEYEEVFQKNSYIIDIFDKVFLDSFKKFVVFVSKIEQNMTQLELGKDMDYLEQNCNQLYESLKIFQKNFKQFVEDYIKKEYLVNMLQDLEPNLEKVKPFQRNMDEIIGYLLQNVKLSNDPDKNEVRELLQKLLDTDLDIIKHNLSDYESTMKILNVFIRKFNEYHKVALQHDPNCKRKKLTIFYKLNHDFDALQFNSWNLQIAQMHVLLKEYFSYLDPQEGKQPKDQEYYKQQIENIQEQLSEQNQHEVLNNFSKALVMDYDLNGTLI